MMRMLLGVLWVMLLVRGRKLLLSIGVRGHMLLMVVATRGVMLLVVVHGFGGSLRSSIVGSRRGAEVGGRERQKKVIAGHGYVTRRVSKARNNCGIRTRAREEEDCAAARGGLHGTYGNGLPDSREAWFRVSRKYGGRGRKRVRAAGFVIKDRMF